MFVDIWKYLDYLRKKSAYLYSNVYVFFSTSCFFFENIEAEGVVIKDFATMGFKDYITDYDYTIIKRITTGKWIFSNMHFIHVIGSGKY